jgi:hypothetical protein
VKTKIGCNSHTAPLPGAFHPVVLLSAARGPLQSRDETQGLLECDGLPLRLVEAIARNSFSLIELAIDFDAPFSSPLLFSPRLADSAAPAAICCALDFAGMIISWKIEFDGIPNPISTVKSESRAIRMTNFLD